MTLPVILAAALLLGTLERLPRARFCPLPFRRAGLGSDCAYFAVGIGFSMVTGGVVLSLSAWLGALGVPRVAHRLPASVAVLLCLVILDLGQYVTHRLLHAVDPLWEIHKVHHSARSLDWLVNSRSHIIETAIRRVLAPLGLVALGTPRGPTVIASVVLSVWAMFIHSNLRVDLRAFEAVLITPRLHRLHHVPATTQKNFGSFLSLWDRVSRSFVAFEPSPTDALGVPGELESYPQAFLPQLVLPLRRIARGRAREPEPTRA
jgi:sterol desaturase/sphingolipid hydroxylase (fatty acid hydroxylase superfamily)